MCVFTTHGMFASFESGILCVFELNFICHGLDKIHYCIMYYIVVQ